MYGIYLSNIYGAQEAAYVGNFERPHHLQAFNDILLDIIVYGISIAFDHVGATIVKEKG